VHDISNCLDGIFQSHDELLDQNIPGRSLAAARQQMGHLLSNISTVQTKTHAGASTSDHRLDDHRKADPDRCFDSGRDIVDQFISRGEQSGILERSPLALLVASS
jgi:hypothetical protein